MKRRQRRVEATSLMITPMIDMFTVMLIFLIVSYAPEQSRIKKSDNIRLPKSKLELAKVPHIQIEVGSDYLSLNGQKLEGLNPSSDKRSVWKILGTSLKSLERSDEPVLVMADKETSYRAVDLAVAHLAAAGFSEVYFLTEKEEEKR